MKFCNLFQTKISIISKVNLILWTCYNVCNQFDSCLHSSQKNMSYKASIIVISILNANQNR